MMYNDSNVNGSNYGSQPNPNPLDISEKSDSCVERSETACEQPSLNPLDISEKSDCCIERSDPASEQPNPSPSDISEKPDSCVERSDTACEQSNYEHISSQNPQNELLILNKLKASPTTPPNELGEDGEISCNTNHTEDYNICASDEKSKDNTEEIKLNSNNDITIHQQESKAENIQSADIVAEANSLNEPASDSKFVELAKILNIDEGEQISQTELRIKIREKCAGLGFKVEALSSTDEVERIMRKSALLHNRDNINLNNIVSGKRQRKRTKIAEQSEDQESETFE